MFKVLFDAFVKYGSTAIAAGVGGYVIAQVKSFRKELAGNRDGTKVLLKDKLHYYYTKFVLNGDGTIPESEIIMANEVFSAYEALGGNGVGKTMIEHIRKLTIV